MTASSRNTIEGETSHYISLETDVGYSYVEWFVDGEHIQTHIGSGLGTTDYLSSYDYDGCGSASGSEVTVKAIAYRHASNTDDNDSESVAVTVWEPIRASTWAKSRVVEKEEVRIRVNTNVPPSKIEYSVDGGEPTAVPVNGATSNQFTYVFGRRDGSSEGTAHTIAVNVEAVVVGTLTKASETESFTVYADMGLMWYMTVAGIESIVPLGEDTYSLNTGHWAYYYNDDDRRSAGLRRRGVWHAKLDRPGARWFSFEGDFETDEVFEPRLTVLGVASFKGSTVATLKQGHFHAVEAYTNLFGLWDNEKGKNGAQVTFPASSDDLDSHAPFYPFPPNTIGGNTHIADTRDDGIPKPKE